MVGAAADHHVFLSERTPAVGGGGGGGIYQ